MNKFSANYEKILESLKRIENKVNFRNQKRKSKLSDIELILIAMYLTCEYMSIDSDHQLFSILSDFLASRIGWSVYKRRKRGLFYYREELLRKIVDSISTCPYYSVDNKIICAGNMDDSLLETMH
ncbi:MAG: hypothetical protein LBL90_12225 [Prevotellaceae bacterium]|jgi:hypothetical protein|nr:hypothetical protein [Prevotellaceae bacterium]